MTSKQLYQMFYRHARRNFRKWCEVSVLYAAMKCRDIAINCQILAISETDSPILDGYPRRTWYLIKSAAYRTVLLARDHEIACADLDGRVLTKKAMKYIRMENVQ